MSTVTRMISRLLPAARRAAALVVGASLALGAQQMVTETRDPQAEAGRGVRQALHRVDRRAAATAARSSTICRSSSGIPTPKDVLGYYIGAPAKLTYYADILKYYRALAKASPRVKVETIGKSDEGRELVVVWVSSDDNIKNLAAEPRRTSRRSPTRADSPTRRSQELIAEHEAALPLHGRPAQRRDGSVGNADGARVSPRDGDVAADHADPQQRHRLDHARRRAGRPRSQRRLVLSRARLPRGRHADAAAGGGAGGGRSAAVADSCRTGASTSTTTTIATSTSRRCRCARSPIGTSPRIRRSCTICTRRSR